MLTIPGCGLNAGGVDLWRAIEEDDGEAVRRYKAAGGDINIHAWSNGSTPLWAALEAKKRYAYEALLECGADPNVIMSGKRVVTHWAAAERDPWWLRLALDHGADPNMVNIGNGRPSEGPPFIFAIGINGTLDNVKLLVDHGAEVNKPYRQNCYPIADAFSQGKYDVVLYLLNHGCKYDIAECQGLRFLDNVKATHGRRNEFLIKEYRDGLDNIYEWLKTRGADID